MSSEDPRQPRDLSGLLKFCIENTAGEDVRAGNESLDEERRQFLAAALSSLTESPIEQLKKAIGYVNNRLDEINESKDSDEVQQLTDSINDCVENIILDIVSSIDFAIDFYKIGGLELIIRCLESPIPSVTAAGCNIIAVTAENNPTVQQQMFDGGFMSKILKLVDSGTSSDVQVKALYATSCLIRENKESMAAFEANDGYSVLVRAVQSSVNKLRIKASFLVRSLVSTNPSARENLFKMGFVEQIIALLHQEHNESHEHLLAALKVIVTEVPDAKVEAAQLGLKNLLESKIKEMESKDEFLEVVNFSKDVLNLCFVTKSNDCDMPDDSGDR